MTYENTSATPPAETADRAPRARLSGAERGRLEGTVSSIRASAAFFRQHGKATAAARADALADDAQRKLDADGAL